MSINVHCSNKMCIDLLFPNSDSDISGATKMTPLIVKNQCTAEKETLSITKISNVPVLYTGTLHYQ